MQKELLVASYVTVAASSVQAQLPLFEGFESFALGSVSSQNGWQIAGGQPVISGGNPSAGSRHLRLTRASGGLFNGAISPPYNVVADQPHSVSVDICISALGAQQARVFSQPVAGPIEVSPWDVRFRPDGHILVLDDADGVPGGAGVNVDTGALWSPGAYFTLRVDRNPIANSVEYFLNGARFYSGSPAGTWGGHVAEQVLLMGNNDFGDGDFIDYDNLLVVPAPGAIALCALSGLGLTRRRR